jgi:hypothetical protein
MDVLTSWSLPLFGALEFFAIGPASKTQRCGSVTFWYGSGSFDPDLAIFGSDLQDGNEKLFFSRFFCLLLFEAAFT